MSWARLNNLLTQAGQAINGRLNQAQQFAARHFNINDGWNRLRQGADWFTRSAPVTPPPSTDLIPYNKYGISVDAVKGGASGAASQGGNLLSRLRGSVTRGIGTKIGWWGALLTVGLGVMDGITEANYKAKKDGETFGSKPIKWLKNFGARAFKSVAVGVGSLVIGALIAGATVGTGGLAGLLVAGIATTGVAMLGNKLINNSWPTATREEMNADQLKAAKRTEAKKLAPKLIDKNNMYKLVSPKAIFGMKPEQQDAYIDGMYENIVNRGIFVPTFDNYPNNTASPFKSVTFGDGKE